MIKLNRGELQVGSVLAWPVYDTEGVLLLNRGERIVSERTLEALIEKGLFREPTQEEQQTTRDAHQPDRRLNPFETIPSASAHLSSIFAGLARGKPEAVERVRHMAQTLDRLSGQDPDALIGIVHLFHEQPYTQLHPLHCASLCALLATRLDYPPARRLSLLCAALTANLGMLELQEQLFLQPGRLTPEQEAIKQGHPDAGATLLEGCGLTDADWLETVRQHHERVNGSGYPRGLHGAAIREEARLMALTDLYCAMVTPRAHRASLPSRQVLRDLFLKRGQLVDETLCAIFIKELTLFPPGIHVKLGNGETAIVIKRGREGRGSQVCAIVSPRGGPYARPLRRDTSQEPFNVQDVCPPTAGLRLNLPLLWGYTVSD